MGSATGRLGNQSRRFHPIENDGAHYPLWRP